MQSVNLLSTASLFSSQESFIIPRYQRPYSWSKQQIEALLLDYEDTIVKDNQEHIMGMIVLCKRPDNTQVIDIIDGQQRITTILIILSWVRDRLFDLSEHPDASITSQSRETAFAYNLDDLVWDPNDEKPRFTTENESHYEAQMLEIVLCRLSEISNQALKKEVREEYRRKYDGEDDVRKSTSSIKKKILSDPRVFNQTRAKAKAIVKNYKLIDEKLGEKLGNEKTIDSQIKFLVKLGRSFSDKLQFVPLVVPNYSQAFRLFETMNDRGLSVSALDLVKNEALQYGSQDERTNTHEAWREAFVDNLPNSKDPLRFLRYAHNARHTFATKNDLFSSYKKSVFDGYDSVVKELEELKQFSSYYNLFLENEWGHDVYFREELVRLKTTKTLQWTTIAMVLLSLDKADLPERRQILKRILRLTHSLVFTQLIKDLRANLFEQYFPTLAVSLWKNRSSTEIDDQLLETERSMKAKLAEIVPPSKEELAALRIENNTIGANICYVLYLKNLSHGASIRTDWTLEHVYPQAPKAEEWPTFTLTEDASLDVNSCYSMGNFILLLKPLNSSSSNKSFTKKKGLYAEKRVVDCLPQSKDEYDIKHVADWTPQIVNQRSILVATALHNAVYSTQE